MLRSKTGQQVHDGRVIIEVGNVTKAGFNKIYAELPECAKPPMFHGYVPDVYAEMFDSNGTFIKAVIIEVETRESLVGPHSFSQHSAFTSFAAKYRNVEYNRVIA